MTTYTIGNFARRLYESPTFNTWGSYATRTLSLLVVLPLLLTKLSPEEIALWYLFSTIITLQGLADLGFSPTFMRSIAYAVGGATEITDLRENPLGQRKRDPNWVLIEKIWQSMRITYMRLTFISLAAILVLGTISLSKPVANVSDQTSAWIGWVIIVLTSGVSFYGNVYASYLQGMNEIAVLRRSETIISLFAILTSVVVLLVGGRLLELVIANQAWVALGVLRNRWLCGKIADGRARRFAAGHVDLAVMRAVWPTAWRSGLGIVMSYGITQSTGIIYAQFGNAMDVAAYLIVMRLIQTVSLFSQAPFYSKLPLLARLRAQGDLRGQVTLAQSGMRMAYWTFILGFISIGVFANPILKFVNGNVKFIDPLLWSLMGVAFFAERYGAMHIQLYSTTNHIIWHIANGISGILSLCAIVLLFPKMNVYAFPVGILAGYLVFYCWYAASHSYKAFHIRVFEFERKAVLAPSVILLSFALVSGFHVFG